MKIETKFSIGDIVFFATTRIVQKQHPCPDCNDGKIWATVSPAGVEYTFPCPRCSASYLSNHASSLCYPSHTPDTRRLTIGSVRTDSYGDRSVSYMCKETGIGSGSIYYEIDLFINEDDALSCATVKAAKANEENTTFVERYNESLRLSDYQLKIVDEQS